MMHTAEKDRILAAEGYVEKGRVNGMSLNSFVWAKTFNLMSGNLALTRGLGDFEYKGNKNLPSQKQIITADPEVVVHSVTEEEEFLVIACDGLFEQDHYDVPVYLIPLSPRCMGLSRIPASR
jgi:protein phosphatase PTC2/3